MSPQPPDDRGTGEQDAKAVHIEHAQGTQVGDHGTQDNRLTHVTAGRDALVAGRDFYVQDLHVHVEDADRRITGDLRPGIRTGQVVVGRIPREPSAFVARETAGRLADAAGSGRMAVVCALTGLRGVGKTQAAAAYARARADEGWGLVGWVNAETGSTLLDGLRQVAEGLGVGDPQGDPSESARRLRDCLQGRPGQGLLVFDNANDPDDLLKFLPATGGTQIVVTSTNRSFAGLGELVDVSVFTRAQSIGYLRARTRLPDEQGANAVADELADLPLGLAQAAATIGRERLTYGAYLQRLSQVPVQDLLGRSPGEDYSQATAAALLMSVQAAEASDSSGLTSWLLRVVATLSPDGIPRAFLDGLPQAQPRSRLARLRPWRGALPRGMGDLVDQCVAGSLLNLTSTGDTVVMHRLVARVLRERDKARGRWTSTVTCAVNLLEPLLFPEELAWSRREDGVRLAAQIEPLREADIETSGQVLAVRLRQIRFWADRQVSAKADEDAIDAGTSTLADREQMLGADHLDTLASRDSLAEAYRDAGRPSAAIPLYERTLADRERLLGTDHPDTLASRDRLAIAYVLAEQPAKAIPLLERILADHDRLQDADHPRAVQSREKLAWYYRSGNRLAEVIPLYERIVADRERLLGTDDPYTLKSRENLADAYFEAGRQAEATALAEGVRADRERLEQKRYSEKIAKGEWSLASCERLRGPDHLDTLALRHNLANIYSWAARSDEAIALSERVMADYERLLGTDHERTFYWRSHLADLYLSAGRAAEAVRLTEQNLADCERRVGADHSQTRAWRKRLAEHYLNSGRQAEAIALHERILADRTRLLGSDHPDTLESRNTLKRARIKDQPT